MIDSAMPLTLWAMNVAEHDLLTRAEAVAPGGFSDMSFFTGDLVLHEAGGGSIRELRRELDAREVSICCIDPWFGWYPGFDPASAPAGFEHHFTATDDDVLRFAEELGAPNVTLLGPFFQEGLEAPFDAQVERLGAFADRAAERGIRPYIEIVPTTKVPTLAHGLALAEAVNRPNLGLLLDTYNLSRSGMDPAEIDDVPHELIFCIQVADAPAVPRGATYFEEATTLRELPGEGDLPVAEILERIARRGPLPPTGPEIANPAFATMSPDEVSRRVAAATRGVLTDARALAEREPA